MGAGPPPKSAVPRCGKPDELLKQLLVSKLSCGPCRTEEPPEKTDFVDDSCRVPLSFLSKVTLFAGLTLEQKAALLDRSVIEDQPEGHVFMKHAGELRNELHIVVMGQVLLGSGGRIVQTLQPGDYFGEVDLATIGDQTVIAEEPTTVLRIKSRHFQELNLVDKLKFTRGVAKSGGYHKAGPGPDGSSSQIPKMAADSADSDPQPDVSRVSTSSLPTIPEVSEEGGYAEDTDDVKENAEGIQTTDNLNLQEMSFPPKPGAEQSIQEFSSPPSKRNSKTQWDDERCAPAGVFCSGF